MQDFLAKSSVCVPAWYPHIVPHNGVYDIGRNEGWVNVGIDHDTAEFAVESIRRWYNHLGKKLYPKGRRFETIEELRKAVEAWMKTCNEKQKGVRWQFNIEKARVKLHSLYPNI